VVVTSAPLFKVDVSQSPYQPEKAGWVPMVREISSGTLNGRYVADAIHAAALDLYLDEHIQSFAAEVQRIATENAELFITSGREGG
jgi:hypothetical protein